MNKIYYSGRGIGGSHFGAFGRQLMLRAPEGDGNSAGASSGDTTATTTVAATTGEPAQPAPGGASEKMLPQSQVSTLIATAKREAREAARREFEAQQAPAAPAKEKTAAAASMSPADVQQIVARERSIERASVGLTPGQQARMEAACRAENPSDVAAWCKSYREDIGLNAQTPAAPAATTAAATEAPKPPAAPAAPSTHALPTANGVLDLFAMTPAQHQALGPQKVRETLEQLWKIGNQMAGAPERPKVPQR